MIKRNNETRLNVIKSSSDETKWGRVVFIYTNICVFKVGRPCSNYKIFILSWWKDQSRIRHTELFKSILIEHDSIIGKMILRHVCYFALMNFGGYIWSPNWSVVSLQFAFSCLFISLIIQTSKGKQYTYSVLSKHYLVEPRIIECWYIVFEPCGQSTAQTARVDHYTTNSSKKYIEKIHVKTCIYIFVAKRATREQIVKLIVLLSLRALTPSLIIIQVTRQLDSFHSERHSTDVQGYLTQSENGGCGRCYCWLI